MREYVLFRDGHRCHGAKGCKGSILNVHHIESRATGGDAPNNLITLCEECHKAYHKGILKLDHTRGQSFRDAAFMGIMRQTVAQRLRSLYPDITVAITYGYITKNTRIKHDLPKEHCVDALCISGNPTSERIDTRYCIKQVRNHNRQLHKMTIQKGGIRIRNQASYSVHGYRLFDKVVYRGQKCFIFGRRSSGYFDLRKLDGTIVHRSASYKELTLVTKKRGFLMETTHTAPHKERNSSPTLEVGVSLR